jgi:hypothetical protein
LKFTIIIYEETVRLIDVYAQNMAKHSFSDFNKLGKIAGRQWLTSVILAAQEAEIRRIAVQSQPWANSS